MMLIHAKMLLTPNNRVFCESNVVNVVIQPALHPNLEKRWSKFAVLSDRFFANATDEYGAITLHINTITYEFKSCTILQAYDLSDSSLSQVVVTEFSYKTFNLIESLI